MKWFSNSLSILIPGIFLACSNTDSLQTDNTLSSLTGNEKAELVLPGIVNTGLYTRDLTMTPDQKELYYSAQIGRFSYAHILYTKFENGNWSKPRLLEYTNNPQFKYYEPFISPDGQKLFYASNEDQSAAGNSDIWVMDRKGSHWDKPYKLDSVVNSKNPEYYPSVSDDGTLYFTREDTISKRNQICRAKLVNGRYQTVKALPAHVNAGVDRFNASIAPDQSYLIIPIYGMPDSYGLTDYYIAFRNEHDQWSQPINMGEKVNSASGEEYSASISPDGKTIYFMTARERKVKPDTLSYDDLIEIYLTPENGKPNIYMISSDFIAELKSRATFN